MNLLDLEQIQKNHRKELEQRLENAKSNLKNLDRMAEEAFREIDRRASEDKEMLSKIFHTLTANEEVTIASLREELGMDKQVQQYTNDDKQELYEPSQSLFDTSNNNLPMKKLKNGGKKDAAI